MNSTNTRLADDSETTSSAGAREDFEILQNWSMLHCWL
jgi:hypothetical protein